MKSITRYRAALGCALLTLAATGAARADTVLGVYAGLGVWQQQLDGDLRSGATTVDIDRELGTDDDADLVAYFALEHPLPGLPNVRLQYASTDLSGAQQLTRAIEINGVDFNFAENVQTEVALEQADAVFYYELLDNYVSLDLGVAVRYVDGRFEVTSALQRAEAAFSGGLPLLYGAVRVDLPLTGLSARAQLMGVEYEGDELLDFEAHLAYESSVGLGAELGWRSLRLDLKSFDELDRGELDISGPYFMINFHF